MSLSLHHSERYFFIKSLNFIDQGERTLVIERQKLKIFEVNDGNDIVQNEPGKITEGPIFGIIGIMNIFGQNYLCVIKEAQILGKLYGAHVYKVTDVKLLPFQMNIIHSVSQYIDELKKYLCDGFYFSYGYDLTSSRQRRIKFLQEKSKDPLRIIASDYRYFWNINLYKDFQEQNCDIRWFTPLIQGYIGIESGQLSHRDIQIALISRRSHMRSGTRYNARGIDDTGNVANFVETEQIVQVENIVFSYVIIRGSVPIFWEQKGMIEVVTITRGPEMTKRAFHNHFDDLFSTYNKVFVIDLLSDTKQREVILTKEYVRQIYESQFKEQVKFLHFDFHHYCSGDRYNSLKVLVGKAAQGIQDFGYFVEDVQGRKIQRFQQGVFRVNCLDSLDRTNVAQSKIGLMILQRQLQKLGFEIEETFGKEVAKEGIAFSDTQPFIIRQIKHFWAEQGDYLSKQYVGTNSTISKVSRDGKEGFMGKIQHKMKNVQRYFINTLSENFSQNSIDIILGKHAYSIISSDLRNYLTNEMRKREDLFTEIKNIKLYIGTWNLAGAKPYETFDLSSWLLAFKDNFIPDIVVVGFQEIVSLNASSIIMGGSQANIKTWNDLVLNNLREHTKEEYVYVTGENLVGIHIALFTKRGINQKLTDIATSKVKLGFQGKVGNKGAALIRFLYEDTSFCFINCHLESGLGIVEQRKRVQQISEIYRSAFIKERGTSQINYSVNNHQVKVIFGDLNYRIMMPELFKSNEDSSKKEKAKEEVRRLIHIQDYEELIKHDEFNMAKKESEILKNFHEGQLIFDPTYKYNANSNVYDTSSKQRIPAWCDRIMYEANSNLTQVYYGRAELKLSDHRPVLGLFEAKIRKINEQAKQEVEEKLIQKYKSLNHQHSSSPTIKSNDKDLPIIEEMNQRKSIKGKRRLSVSGSVVEPSIGDFGLIEPQDSHQSPRQSFSQSLIIKDTEELEQIIKEQSILINDEEVKKVSNEVYPVLLEQHSSVLQSVESMPQLREDILEREAQLSQFFFKEKLNQPKKGEQASNIIKTVGLFNKDSEDEEEEKGNTDERNANGSEQNDNLNKQHFPGPSPKKVLHNVQRTKPLFSDSDGEDVNIEITERQKQQTDQEQPKQENVNAQNDL